MKKLVAGICLAGSVMLGASLPKGTSVRGEYMEARTADVYTGPCYANSEVDLVGNLAVMGWRVNKGVWEGVSLDGLSVVGVVKANSTLGNVHGNAYPVKSLIIVDEKASPEQRLALKSFAQRMGGDLLSDVVRVEYQPITMEFEKGDMHSRVGKLSAGTLAEIRTRALEENDNHCSNEVTWYPPLTKLAHSMPAFALTNTYKGNALNTTWSSPDKRSAFVGSFQFSE